MPLNMTQINKTYLLFLIIVLIDVTAFNLNKYKITSFVKEHKCAHNNKHKQTLRVNSDV